MMKSVHAMSVSPFSEPGTPKLVLEIATTRMLVWEPTTSSSSSSRRRSK